MCVTVKYKRGYSLYISNPEGIQVTLVQNENLTKGGLTVDHIRLLRQSSCFFRHCVALVFLLVQRLLLLFR